MEEESEGERSHQSEDSTMKKFVKEYNEYKSILNDTSPRFKEAKETIRQVFAPKESELDNFLEMRRWLLDQESKYRKQGAEDAKL